MNPLNQLNQLMMRRAPADDTAPPSLLKTEWSRWLVGCLLLGVAYGIAARTGLAYSSLAPNVTLIWAPTGISLFAVLRWGPRLWPGIIVGDLIANTGTGVALWVILGISAGNLLQTLVCAWALRRHGFNDELQRVRDVVALLSLGTACAAISALIGPGALALSGAIDPAVYSSVFLQWWMGDATGVIVVTPLLLAWWNSGRVRFTRRRSLEGGVLLLLLGALCAMIFDRWFGEVLSIAPGYYPASLALFPLAVWAALRFGLRGATLLTLLLSVAAVWGTLRGMGPFVDATQTSSLLRWWVFANVITVTSLLLASSQSERDHARIEAIRDRDFSTAVLDVEGALVVVLDADWRIRRVNRAFEALTGFSLNNLVGQRFETALIPEHQRDKFSGHAEMTRLNLSAGGWHDSLLRCQRGPPIAVSWTTSVLRDNKGRIEHAIVSGVDISARVEAAEALRHARRQLQLRVAERTRDLAQANADLQVQMVERQRLEAEIINISEREQQRFGQELHDGLGQHLTAAAIQTELLARDLEAAGQTTAQHSAEGVEAMISDAIAQTRLLARGLFPVELEDNGLMAALQQLAEHTQGSVRRPCVLDCPIPVELSDHTVAIHVYRVAQEAVNNAIKHAPGTRIDIVLRRVPTGLQLIVSNDTGHAGEVQPPSGATGMGLRIMRHRARLIGAELAFGNTDGEWRVVLNLPVAEPSSAGGSP